MFGRPLSHAVLFTSVMLCLIAAPSVSGGMNPKKLTFQTMDSVTIVPFQETQYFTDRWLELQKKGAGDGDAQGPRYVDSHREGNLWITCGVDPTARKNFSWQGGQWIFATLDDGREIAATEFLVMDRPQKGYYRWSRIPLGVSSVSIATEELYCHNFTDTPFTYGIVMCVCFPRVTIIKKGRSIPIESGDLVKYRIGPRISQATSVARGKEVIIEP